MQFLQRLLPLHYIPPSKTVIWPVEHLVTTDITGKVLDFSYCFSFAIMLKKEENVALYMTHEKMYSHDLYIESYFD